MILLLDLIVTIAIMITVILAWFMDCFGSETAIIIGLVLILVKHKIIDQIEAKYVKTKL